MQQLKERPEEFGALYGGRFKAKERQEAQRQARVAADYLGHLSRSTSEGAMSASILASPKGFEAARKQASEAKAAAVAKSLEAPKAHAKALLKDLRAMPTEKAMQRSAARSFKTLGIAAASQSLGPQGAVVLSASMTTYQTARLAAKKLELGADKTQEDMRDRGMGR